MEISCKNKQACRSIKSWIMLCRLWRRSKGHSHPLQVGHRRLAGRAIAAVHYSIWQSWPAISARCLGITPDADQSTIKNAYRRLTKQYHPDTTELPVEIAAQKFVRLKEAHNILSSPEKRRLYDWQLASVVSTSGRFVWPYEVDRSQRGAGSRPRQNANGSSAKNSDGSKPLGDDSIAALAFDGFALVVAIIVIIYVVYFKDT